MAALIVLSVIIVVWALVEIVQAERTQVRRLPKLVWAALAILSPIGAIAWFFLGRPKIAVNTPGARSTGAGTGLSLPRRQRYVARPAPDDDPEFLRKLNAEVEQRKLLRRMQDDLDANGETPKADPTDPDGDTRPRD